MTRTQRLTVLVKSRTVWGAFFASGAWLVQQHPITGWCCMQAVAMWITAVGARDAITKSSPIPPTP